MLIGQQCAVGCLLKPEVLLFIIILEVMLLFSDHCYFNVDYVKVLRCDHSEQNIY